MGRLTPRGREPGGQQGEGVRAPGIEHIDDHVEVDGISRADGLAQPGQGLADGRKPGGTQGPVDQIRHLIDDRV
jgi:hypothetical protein